MLKILNNKKIIILISIIFLVSFCLLIPTSLGYGYGFSDAEIKRNGTYYEELDYYDDYAYYKVYCRSGDYLIVDIEVGYPSYDVDLDLYDEYYLTEDSSSSDSTSDIVYAYVYSRTHYYIRVERDFPSTGYISFTLTISGATGYAIPGFEIITLLIGIISVSCVIYLRVKRKNKTKF
ncbi:MAG: hypothetical protein ACFE78_03830 [Candidatus Hodarchaeota archaeon]